MNQAVSSAPPKVGFVSLGCPKALTDSELILTQLSAEGYTTSKSFAGADLVIVNTCGFIDEAVKESLDTIGEALAENGKVIVTGCLGARAADDGGGNLVRQVHPKVLAVTGPHATQEVMDAVHLHLPKPHDPFVDLVPPQGIKLTPRHYAYLKISEGCNHRCTFCIIPSMRGDLVSRPIGDVLGEAQRLFEAGVKELLVVSQDTSAYGVDVKYRTGFWNGQPLRTRMLELCEKLGELADATRCLGAPALRLPVPACRRGAAADGGGPRAALPGRAVPALASRRAAAHEASGQRREEPRTPGALARAVPRAGGAQHLHRRLSRRDGSRVRAPAAIRRRGWHRPRRLLCLLAGQGRGGERIAGRLADRRARAAPGALHGRGRARFGSAPAAAHRRDDAGAGRQRAGARPQGRCRTQLRRRAGDRRHGAPPAAGQGQQGVEGGRVHPRQGRSPPTATTWLPNRSSDDRPPAPI